MEALLSVKKLTCSRGDRQLFDQLSFEVSSGQLLQVVGRNGVGKTSLLRTLVGLVPFSQGDVHWRGQSIRNNLLAYQQQIFYHGHASRVKLSLTPFENLQLDVSLNNVTEQDIIRALEQVSLRQHINSFCSTLSQGQRTRVALAKLLLTQARLWILDEPFAALDVDGITMIEKLFATHLNKGGMIIMATHQRIGSTDLAMMTLELKAYL